MKLKCNECEFNKNGWCLKLKTNKKQEKQDNCVFDNSESKECLKFIYDKLINEHKENLNAEYMLNLKYIMDKFGN